MLCTFLPFLFGVCLCMGSTNAAKVVWVAVRTCLGIDRGVAVLTVVVVVVVVVLVAVVVVVVDVTKLVVASAAASAPQCDIA